MFCYTEWEIRLLVDYEDTNVLAISISTCGEGAGDEQVLHDNVDE